MILKILGSQIIYLIYILFINHQISKASSDIFNQSSHDGHCIWYGFCDKNPEKPQFMLNCRYEGKAKTLYNPIAIKALRVTCPELVEEIIDEYGKLVTCCDIDQIEYVAAQLATMGVIMSNCPACHSNIRKNLCSLSCHPQHSTFLNPTLLYGNDSIRTVTQYLSYEYIDSAFASCEHLYFSEMNGPALDLLCGPWGASYCTPQRLFDYFGNNFMTPFNITDVYSDYIRLAPDIDDPSQYHVMYPFNVETFPCNSSDPLMHCRCMDCLDSCVPIEEIDSTSNDVIVGSMHLYVFLIILLYLCFAVLFLIFGIWKGFPGNENEKTGSCSFNHKLSANFEEKLRHFFFSLSKKVVCHPYLVLAGGALLVIAMSFGIIMVEMTTDPVELWASPQSRTRKEKDYYDKNFGPFYRTNQIIITSVGIDEFNHFNHEFGPVFNDTFLEEVLEMQLQIMNLTAEYDGSPVTLNDVCIKPLWPTYDDCLIQSVLNYFQNDPDVLEGMMFDENGTETYNYLKHLTKCLNNPSFVTASETCLGTYGGAVLPYVALGGFLEGNETIANDPHYELSTALVLTFVGQNYLDKEKLGPSLAWEKAYLDFMETYSNPIMNIAYYSERSVEDEVIREGKSDISTILISYFVMFAYVAVSLGKCDPECNKMCIRTKVSLGLCSVVLVFLSVVSAIGLCGYMGVKGTFFVIEVVPFLVLAVGADNTFLLVRTWQREERKSNESIEEHVSRVVGKIAPSMLIASSSEIICFFLGALSEMPAIYSFSIYAGIALTFDFLLQITCLVALIMLDAKRENSNRLDVVCCTERKRKPSVAHREDVCESFFKHVLAPFLFKDYVRAVVVLVFVGGLCTSCVFIPKMDIGLEQNLGMPQDSYVLKYFDFMNDYLSVGAPVYFVVKEGFNYPDIEEQNIICQSFGCNIDSALTQIYWASQSPHITYIATGAASWLDSYFLWISDTGGLKEDAACCRLDENGTFIDSSASEDNRTDSTCLQNRDFVEDTNRPLPQYFMEYLPDFLIDNPHEFKCPQAGHPAYGTSVVIKAEGCNAKLNYGYRDATYNETTCVGANNFMAYHSILKVSMDFTNALDKVYQLTDYMNDYIKNQSSTPDVEIFPYSLFYVYYEQYLTMWTTVAVSLSVSFVAVFLVMLIITAFDFRTSVINLIIIFMIIVDIMALMVPCNIQLNAISLVNLVMAVGISVEFSSHITHTFALSTLATKIERASNALSRTGSSVFSGITLTKFFGIIVLAFANMQIITVFYFRMYLMIVLLGAAHGLIFLPVLLSLIGPERNPYIRD